MENMAQMRAQWSERSHTAMPIYIEAIHLGNISNVADMGLFSIVKWQVLL